MALSIDLDAQISPSFKWREALLLREWGWHAHPHPEHVANILKVAQRLEIIKTIFGNAPIIIQSWYRPNHYNHAIGGSLGSAHMTGEAVDFRVSGMHSYDVRRRLESELENLQIRMERLWDTANWCHIDIRQPIGGLRYFSPHKRTGP